MRIFISHSSKDRWIARRIAQDLHERGATTFLDEKDIKTGESIDDAIGKHLKDCDELLVLISPTSLNSHWVFVEIGGAKALGKGLMPILLHVGANEVPAPISKHLARDINDIEKYYDEVSEKIKTGAKPPKRAARKKAPTTHPNIGVRQGDTVEIVDSSVLSDSEKAAFPSWLDEMDRFSGKVGKVTAIDWSDRPSRSIKLDIDKGKYWWAAAWLRKVPALKS